MKNIVLLGVADNVFAITPKMGINNAQDMIAYAKKILGGDSDLSRYYLYDGRDRY